MTEHKNNKCFTQQQEVQIISNILIATSGFHVKNIQIEQKNKEFGEHNCSAVIYIECVLNFSMR